MSKLTREGFRAMHEQAAEALERSRSSLNVLICAGTGCIASGSMKVYENLREECAQRGLQVYVGLTHHGDAEKSLHIKMSGCHGFCEMGPLVHIEPLGVMYVRVKPEDCREIVERTLLGGEVIERLTYHQDGVSYPRQEDIPFYKKQHRVVLASCGASDAENLEEYIAKGGYTAFEKALFDMDGAAICREIANSGLRGRGGGGFPAGRKWESVRRHTEEPVKYIVCNGDEGDPGAFMDRSIMEGDPHSVLEGMMIAGAATGATEGYIYVRAEYPLAVKRLQVAIDKAAAAGLLGDDILGSGFSFHIHINRGAGAFVCGEGSALTASIEGKRGMPRVKPPRTVDHGLWGKPTVLNNVETFANVPNIINKGAAWYRSIGTEGSAGTKTFALTGNVVNTGLVEVPMGATLREIIYDIGGGIPNGKKFKAVQIGGPSGGCLTEEHLDYPMDFDSLKKLGAIIGSGGLVVMDEDTCMVEVARFFMHFTQNESCGKCTPCREGTKRMLETLERIINNEGSLADLDLLESLSDTITDTALCGLGQTACKPVMSTLRNFRQDYLRHVVDNHCPICNGRKRRLELNPHLCNGCGKCIPNCPEGALQLMDGKARLVSDLFCDGLGACIGECPLGAIQVVEREAEPYDERKVMENIIRQGPNTIKAHLKHLKEHGEFKLLETAVNCLREQNLPVPDLREAGKLPCGCPGTLARRLAPRPAANSAPAASSPSALRQWPVQLKLLNPAAEYFDDADLLISADCVAHAFGGFHRELLDGKILVVFCPKLDNSTEEYVEKLAEIFRRHRIRSITVARMEVPCCGGLENAAKRALQASGKFIPWQVVTISTDGRILD